MNDFENDPYEIKPNNFELTHRHKLIAHRNNLRGPAHLTHESENDFVYVSHAFIENFDVELDVWCIQNKFYLGHDRPGQEVSIKFLENKNIWCHAKNVEALAALQTYPHINVFGHNVDDMVFTSHKWLWTSSPKVLSLNINKAVFVLTDDVFKVFVREILSSNTENYRYTKNIRLLSLLKTFIKNENKICTDYPLLLNKLLNDACSITDLEITINGLIQRKSKYIKVKQDNNDINTYRVST